MDLRATILASDDIPVEMVDVPEWGVTIEVRGMNGADREAVLNRAAEGDGLSVGGMYVDTVIACSYDPQTGQRVFSADDSGVLRAKSAAAIDRIAKVGMRLSGMDEGASEEAKKRFPDEPE